MTSYRLKRKSASYFRNHFLFLFFIVLFLIIGIILGAIAVQTLTYQQKNNLLNYLSKFNIEVNQLLGNNQQLLAKEIIVSNLKVGFLFWILGLTVVGILVIPIIILLKGFIIGFTVSFLVDEMFFKGILLALVSIFPQNLIIFFSLVLGALFSWSFVFRVGKGFLFGSRYSLGQHLIRYSLLMIVIGCLLFIAGVVEVYLTPHLLKLVEAYII